MSEQDLYVIRAPEDAGPLISRMKLLGGSATGQKPLGLVLE